MNGLRGFFYFLACMLVAHGWQVTYQAMPGAVSGTPAAAPVVSACHQTGHSTGGVHDLGSASEPASAATAHGGAFVCQIACALAGAPALVSPGIVFDETVLPLRVAVIPVLLLIEAAAPDHPPPIA